MLGTNVIVFFAYLIGKHPHDIIYTYSTFVMGALLTYRCVTFWQKGWKFYLVDFCYFANFVVFYFINCAPKSQWLFISCFVIANGLLASAVAAFRNSLVYHKIDLLTSLAVHSIPMCLTHHIKWYTIPDQTDLPADR